MPVDTVSQQVELISSISNFHWWASLTLKGDKKTANSVRNQERLLFYPGTYKYVPVSPRNQTLYYFKHDDSDHRFLRNISYLIRFDREQEDLLKVPLPTLSSDTDPNAPPPKKRRYATRTKKVKVISASPQDLLDDLSCTEGGDSVTSAVPQRSHFTLFSEELITAGTIQWRSHSDMEDIVVLSDYDPSTGKLKPLDYCHVTASIIAPDNVQIKCTCRIYQYMQGKAMQKAQLELDEEPVLANNFTCMHCRFYMSTLTPMKASLFSHNPSNQVEFKIHQSLANVNNPIVLLGSANAQSVSKLSVLGGDSTSLVHIHFYPNATLSKCMNGICEILFGGKKKLPLGPISFEKARAEGDGLCPHLQTLFANKEFLTEAFPGHFGETIQDQENDADEADSLLGDDVMVPGSEVNVEDADINDHKSDLISFDADSGQWVCRSYSKHQPKPNCLDPKLVEHVTQRKVYLQGDPGCDGFYTGPDLEVSLENDDGSPRTCLHGVEFTHDQAVSHKAKVYTRQVTYNYSL